MNDCWEEKFDFLPSQVNKNPIFYSIVLTVQISYHEIWCRLALSLNRKSEKEYYLCAPSADDFSIGCISHLKI